ncbi:MAG: (2Fe-2S)-binding protein [Rhodobacteraceae bacterium]|nr:(2Fe-2S)-binding protein [Paracoccaceae bacterium]
MTDAATTPPVDLDLRRRDAAAALAAEPNRLVVRGIIDRAAPRRFQWEGRELKGYAGDTLASALIASGVRTVARGFKYHRPRGVMSAGVEEGGAIVAVGEGDRRIANINAATQELYEGLAAFGQNAWPSVSWDAARVNDRLGRFLGAGFYYKTFFSFTPNTPDGTGHWMLFERAIRAAAGMGKASREPDPDQYEAAHAHCDMLVVGSGPAGLEAARVAAEAGLDVILAEQDFELGGRLLAEAAEIDSAAPGDWRDQRLAALRAAGVRIMLRTTVFGLYDGGVAGMMERVAHSPEPHQVRERFWTVRADRIVLATGAIERGLAFGENDRPGVMTAGAAQAYVNRFGVAPGRRAVVATTHDGGLGAAADLAAAGLEVAILDARTGVAREIGDTPSGLGAAVSHLAGAAPLRTLGRARALGDVGDVMFGDGGVAALEIALDTDRGWRVADRIECDMVAVSGGWSPVVNLLSHRGVKPVWDTERLCFLPGETSEPIEVCGAAAGVWEAGACAASGRNAVARLLGRTEEEAPLRRASASPPREMYEVRAPGRKLKSFIDPQHDVTTEDVRQAACEGYVSVEHLKRYTTLGMATDQGKNGNILGLAVMAEALKREIPEVGTTTFRPPYTPVSLGVLAGRSRGKHFKPKRRTPLHAWSLAQGAVMTDAGLWRRSWYFPHAMEGLDDAYIREAAAVRASVGLCDVTSLGKISVQGPDAGEFLNRVYVNGMAKLPVGKARYGVMLRDDGLVFDDGAVWRLGETDYLVTTTTAGAGKVMSWLEELSQTRWPELRVALSSVTDRWAGVAVAGPQARNLLTALVEDVDFEDAAFPFMGVRAGRLKGGEIECWLARLSFSGELAYEIYVESDHAPALMDVLWEGAKALGGVLYGTEALGALRIEKGHVAGPELDGRTTLADLGLGAMGSTKKPYLGAALAQREVLADAGRQRLVGLTPLEEGAQFKAGSILCRVPLGESPSGHGVGWVSSVTYSPALGHWIGLGFIEGGIEKAATRKAEEAIIAADPVRGAETRVRVVSPHFIDPEGARMRPEADPAPGADLSTINVRPSRRSAFGTLWLDGLDNRAADDPNARRVVGRVELDDPEDPVSDAQDAAVWLVEERPRPLWRVEAWPGRRAAVEGLLRELSGGAAPAYGRTEIGEDEIELSRAGPLSWRVLGLGPEGGERLAMMDAEDGAALELSHAEVAVRIGGREAATLLNRFLPLDLRDASFPEGSTAITGFHHTPVTLDRLSGASIPPTYRLWVPRSYAWSLWGLLRESAAQWRG